MVEVTNELIYEVLKAMQSRLGNVETSLSEVKAELHAMRGHMLATQTDIANLYAGQGNIDGRLARIERRLELTDAPLTACTTGASRARGRAAPGTTRKEFSPKGATGSSTK